MQPVLATKQSDWVVVIIAYYSIIQHRWYIYIWYRLYRYIDAVEGSWNQIRSAECWLTVRDMLVVGRSPRQWCKRSLTMAFLLYCSQRWWMVMVFGVKLESVWHISWCCIDVTITQIPATPGKRRGVYHHGQIRPCHCHVPSPGPTSCPWKSRSLNKLNLAAAGWRLNSLLTKWGFSGFPGVHWCCCCLIVHTLTLPSHQMVAYVCFWCFRPRCLCLPFLPTSQMMRGVLLAGKIWWMNAAQLPLFLHNFRL